VIFKEYMPLPPQSLNGFLATKINDEALHWASVLTVIEAIGVAALKYYAKTNDMKFFAIGELSYISQAYVLQRAFRDNKLGIVNAYWNGLTNVTNGLIGMSMGETYTKYQFAGIGLITAGILLL
jgi:multidrug transporter EmrE-like cation transporter